MAPTLDFIQRCFIPAVAKLGIQADVVCKQSGFFTVGGGVVEVDIQPRMDRKPLTLLEYDEVHAINADSGSLNLDIAERELETFANMLMFSQVNVNYFHFLMLNTPECLIVNLIHLLLK